MTVIRNVNIGKNELGFTAWGVSKVSNDNSLFHGMFTYNVPVATWYERINTVVQSSFTNTSSVDGALKVLAGATLNDVTNLRTYRNPRYEPNRGFIYSTAGWMINADTALMNRSFGVGTYESGVFFRLESGVLKGVIRTTESLVTTEDTVVLDTTGIDLSKGNVFDVQYQWRGVGSYVFFLNLKEVGRFSYLGTRTSLTMYNPTVPLFFESENLGDNDAMYFGCVDVSSEGGKDNGKTYGSVSTDATSGQITFPGGGSYNTPAIAIRSKVTVGGLINTRDTLALLASGYTDQRCFIRIWETRDFTAITDGTQTWTDFGDGHLEYVQYDPSAGTPITFDTTKATLVLGGRIYRDQTYSTSALFEGRTNIYQTPGDMFIFTLHRETGGSFNGGVTYEFAEAI